MGELAALANAIIWATTGVVTKGVGPNVRPTHIVSAQVWIGLLFLLTVGLIVGEIDALIHLNVRSAAFLAGGALVNTAGSLVFWLALSRGTVSRVYPTTQSVFIMTSVFAGWLFLGDDLELEVLGGAAFIIIGVVLLNWKPSNPDSASQSTGRGSSDLTAIGLGVTTSLLWTGGFLSTVIGLEDTPPVAAATIRNLVPATLFVLVAFFFPSQRVTRVFKDNGMRLFASAILFAVSALTFVLALDQAPPSVVVVLINTSPMWAVVLATVLLRERLSKYALAGAALSVAGIFVTLALR
jgi:drug/metabolite transporter (DMT)-like permease